MSFAPEMVLELPEGRLSEAPRQLLARADRPTALVAGGNQLLAGVLKAAQQRGLSVPKDLSVITCDRTELSEIYAGGVTTIDRDVAEIGRTAAQLLLERLADRGDRPARRVVLPTRLVLGSSCAAPPNLR